MICHFCSQWNPVPAKRCCFCQNQLDAAEDGTASGTLSAAHQGLAQLPGQSSPPSAQRRLWPAGEPDLARHGQTLDRAKLIWTAVVAIGFGIWMLVQMKFGCNLLR